MITKRALELNFIQLASRTFRSTFNNTAVIFVDLCVFKVYEILNQVVIMTLYNYRHFGNTYLREIVA